jgi:hypothetical protein
MNAPKTDAPRTDIYQFQARMSQHLALWSGFSIGAALLIALLHNCRRDHQPPDSDAPVWCGLASQFAGWGIIDLGIAWLGLSSSKKRAADPAAHNIAQQHQARAHLRKLLWVNTGLDIGYIAGGALLSRTKGRHIRFWRGAGRGIILQGGFLFIFDLIHALLLND